MFAQQTIERSANTKLGSCDATETPRGHFGWLRDRESRSKRGQDREWPHWIELRAQVELAGKATCPLPAYRGHLICASLEQIEAWLQFLWLEPEILAAKICAKINGVA